VSHTKPEFIHSPPSASRRPIDPQQLIPARIKVNIPLAHDVVDARRARVRPHHTVLAICERASYTALTRRTYLILCFLDRVNVVAAPNRPPRAARTTESSSSSPFVVAFVAFLVARPPPPPRRRRRVIDVIARTRCVTRARVRRTARRRRELPRARATSVVRSLSAGGLFRES
jgi:hypothetical protein